MFWNLGTKYNLKRERGEGSEHTKGAEAWKGPRGLVLKGLGPAEAFGLCPEKDSGPN